MKELALFGYGGHAREVSAHIAKPITFFVEDQWVSRGTLPLTKFDPDRWKIMIAVAEPMLRKKIVESLPEETEYFSYIHPSSLILGDEFELGSGSFIGSFCVVTTNVKIGNHAIINRGNQIGHDCLIGDYFSMMPGAIIGGNVTIGNRVYMGSCANIKQKIYICDDTVLGMNSATVKNIHEPGTYVGVPSKKRNS
jgi:sugar O-acyltransferase (sialic acid O-acetyltransferase NeuD family)